MAGSAGLVVVAAGYSLLIAEGRALWLPALTGVWFLAVLNFFRDPVRKIPVGQGLILSPASGKVVQAGPEERLDGMRRLVVSVFMSPLDVHVNRSPVTGTVKSVEHRPGRFHSAFKPVSSRENEQTVAVLQSEWGEVEMRQVAGALARRVVFHPRPGDFLKAGDRVGMIRFGSRVDLYLPSDARLRVKVGQRVVSGESIIGVLGNGQTGMAG